MVMAGHYYMFGAGNNCVGAVNWWGKDNIIAIVDNSPVKVGMNILSVPVISFGNFMQLYKGETVIITAYHLYSEIIAQLNDAGITNVFVAPNMQTSFWSVADMYKKLGLSVFSCIYMAERSPMTERLTQYILTENHNSHVSYGFPEAGMDSDDFVIVTFENKNRQEMCSHKLLNVLQEMRIARSLEYAFLTRYKNLHKDNRCFVIGNGPSLRTEDLDLLCRHEEICFASNRIYNVYDKTEWRPDYYCVGDGIVYLQSKGKFLGRKGLFMRDILEELREDPSIIRYPCRESKFTAGKARFSDDLVHGVYGGRSVTYDMLQIAAYMGFSEIYLLGMDFTSGQHFYKGSIDDSLAKDASVYMGDLKTAFRAAEDYSRSHGFRIYNATRGGALEVFERVDFDSLF